MTKVRVFMVEGDAGNQALVDEVARTPDCSAEVFTCPNAIANVQPMPFLQIEGGERFYGKEGIQIFLAERKPKS